MDPSLGIYIIYFGIGNSNLKFPYLKKWFGPNVKKRVKLAIETRRNYDNFGPKCKECRRRTRTGLLDSDVDLVSFIFWQAGHINQAQRPISWITWKPNVFIFLFPSVPKTRNNENWKEWSKNTQVLESLLLKS